MRYYAGGKIFRRSTKCTTKPDAFTFAKKLYDDINFKTHQALLRGKEDNFEVCARAVIAQQEFQVKRDEMSAEMAQADTYRLEKEVLPFFRQMSVVNDRLRPARMQRHVQRGNHQVTGHKAQPTTLRLYTSTTTARYKYPAQVTT